MRSVNSFQQRSSSTYFLLNVGPPPGPVGSWGFDDGSGSTAADGPGLTHPLTLTGASFEASGRLHGALAVDGADDYASATGPVVDTAQSFSIATWVRPANLSKLGVVAAVNGVNTASVGLGYDPSSKRWVLARTSADVRRPALHTVSSKELPVLGAWSHLLATYDAPSGVAKLFVNGRLQQELTIPAAQAWQATGPLTVGRALVNGAPAGYFAGSIDNLQVWQRVLRPEEVIEAQAPREPDGVIAGDAAHWPLDTAVRGTDRVWRSPEAIRGADLTVSGFPGADQSNAFVDDPERGKVLELTGSSRASVVLNRPVVDASASFEVAVKVKLTDPTKPGVLIRQGTAGKDSWRLAYEPDADGGRFIFARSNAGATTETVATLKVYADFGELDGWHLLTATYRLSDRNPADDRISLAFDLRSRSGSSTTFTAPRRDGATTIGTPGSTGTPFTGRLDNLRIYAGTPSPTRTCTDYPGTDGCGS